MLGYVNGSTKPLRVDTFWGRVDAYGGSSVAVRVGLDSRGWSKYFVCCAWATPAAGFLRAFLLGGNSRQEGEIRCDSADCDAFLTEPPMSAQIELVRNYAIQIQVESFNYGSVTFKTDHWPPLKP